ncbi:alpha-2-macroglobulin [Gammaproteobacteria bacterium 45_16_T64]|nr:alpha-2-macroglobulin [Gammaproteobacteria bacterium 45_16_T64]
MRKLLLFPFVLLSFLVGKVQWAAPPWLLVVGRFRSSRPGYFWGAIALLIAVMTGASYYDSLPKPVRVKGVIQSLDVTGNVEGAQPDLLRVNFSYDTDDLKPDQQRPEGEPSVARIDLLGERVTSGIRLSPVKKGQWTWVNDNTLHFTPENDWAPGVNYTVSFDKSIFSSETLLAESEYVFTTPELSFSVSNLEFYQDPLDTSIRRVVATLGFSHPVDKQSVEAMLALSMRPSGAGLVVTPKPFSFSVSYDKNLREAYIQSEPISLPQQPSYMKVSVEKGVKSIFGGEQSHVEIEQKVLIPDIYSFLKVSQAETRIVRNLENDPEQMLTLEFTDDISIGELKDKISLYQLPAKGEPLGKSYWRGPRKVSNDVLSHSKKLPLDILVNERDASKLYSLRVDIPENRYLYVKIEPKLTSVNNFVHGSFYDTVLKSPDYPKEIDIAGEGSILTYSGERHLSVLSRGLKGLKYTVGKLKAGQLNHLITQTNGDISDPRFSNWNFNEQNIAEFSEVVVDIPSDHPKTSHYSSLELGQFLEESKRGVGLFFVKVEGWDSKHNRQVGYVSDKRLILITDLGVIVKNNRNTTHDVFVQSIQTGSPVSGASVTLLGKNGIPLFTRTLSDAGHTSFPSTKDFRKEKQPTVYVVKHGDDMSFIPFNRHSRQINLTRFDIGGVRKSNYQQDALNAYLFSDRGIYRPGETITVGSIVKNSDFSNVEGIPLEWVIRGPRNNELSVKKITLPEMGFFDFQYASDTTSDTGRYKASLHLVRDNKYRGREVGSTYFSVEEFQPDTMKIESRLVDVTSTGWLNKESVKAKVSLQNLFGVPAQDRKVSGRMTVTPTTFNFSPYQDYTFTDPYADKNNKPLQLDEYLPEMNSDADGLAEFVMDLQRFRQGTYRLRFVTEGFEQGGGRSVMASNSILISPLTSLVGHKADGRLDYINTNTERNIEFIALNSQIKRIELSGMTASIKAIQRVSTLVKQKNGTYQYQSIKKENEILTQPLDLPVEGYIYSIPTTDAGDFAIEIFDANQVKLSRVEYSVVGHGNLAGKLDKNAELRVVLDKSDYLPGDWIEMNIRAPYAGAGLITIETDKVHHFTWFSSEVESSIQRIKIPDTLEGTGYVNVTFVRDVGSKEIYVSPLSYAVLPFSIDKSKRKIDIDLAVNDIVRPGEPMTMSYSTSAPARIAIFAVDEGILQVAKYQTPNPLSHFLKKRALEVNTLQILDLILPDFNVVKTLSASGGGSTARKALGKNINPFARKTDAPAVYWSGIHDAGTDARTVTFTVPNTFAGALRVMAVAVGEASVGTATDSTTVRGPFVISPNVLTQAAPGDEFVVTVGIANIIDGSGDNALVTLKSSASSGLEILGNAESTLRIDEGGEGSISLRVRAKQQLGAATLTFDVSHKEEHSRRTASLSIRPVMPYRTSLMSGFDSDGDVRLTVERDLYSNLATQTIAASTSPLVVVDGLTDYLENFPHGCTEQVVSKVFPLAGLMTHPTYAPHVTKVNEFFTHLMGKLRERQQADGGFAYWPGQTYTAEYPSIYVMHFLIESSQLGYPVPSDMLQRGKDYLADYVGRASETIDDARSRAIAVYLLTRMGSVTTNYLVDLEESLGKNHKGIWEQDILSAYIAATYQLLQNDAEANRLIQQYQLGEQSWKGQGDFYSTLTLDSQYVYLLSRHFEQRARALDGEDILTLTDPIFKGEYNTIGAAYGILGLGAYSKLVMDDKVDTAMRFLATSLAGEQQELKSNAIPFNTAGYSVGTKTLSLDAGMPLFYLNSQAGFDRPSGAQTVKSGIEIHRDFIDDDGNSVTRFEQGKELTVRLRVRGLLSKTLTNIAVIDLLPGGFEVIRSSVSRKAYGWRADYVDIREDRVVFYGSFDSSVRELTYKVKLTAAGKFSIPPSFAESMYDRSITAISTAGVFDVFDDKH